MPKKSLLIQCALMVLFTLVLLWTVPATAAHHESAAAAAAAKDAATRTVYTCGCCDMVADQPGKAPCGMPLIEKQVLKEDADKIYVCACADGCKCGLNQADPTKCACGKELRAYPKGAKMGCAHGLPATGCDKPCCAKAPAAAK